MAEPFLGEIRMMSFGFAPQGWALCNGQLLPINQNQALFSLLGTQFGGNGQVNFALPNQQGRVGIHDPSNMGERGGAATHTLTLAELPTHTHAVNAANNTTNSRPNGLNPGATTMYGPATNLTTLHSTLAIGGSQAHLNMQPFLVMNFCIALQGIFPSQT